ncbi:MAG: hypothetical protein DRR08_05545 [Candidatus Parabeggiatoa sp. nov. 2]|nr:MAG: hypothetical protein B6247_01265 [Beggiatoa sp. 4572_84]RKZ62623.1 MAG: hypothetical protein DRR08_05545 [Gammaproteobacteria bacterium]
MTALKNNIIYFLWSDLQGFFKTVFIHSKINDIKWWVANSLIQFAMTDSFKSKKSDFLEKSDFSVSQRNPIFWKNRISQLYLRRQDKS